MDLFSIILFLGLYYVRPHEWVAFVADLNPFRIAVGLGVVSLFTKHKGLGWRDFIKTPHDWFMLVYLLWIVYASDSHWDTFMEMYNLFVFYWIAVITLDSVQRLQTFLNWWAFFILVLSALALASEYGFDPTGSYDITHGYMKDRLMWNTSIFNNPNALGHSVAPGIVMIYFIIVWNRPIFSRVVIPALLFLPMYCVYLTQSKGAFLTSFATAVTAISFKRPIMVQAAIFVVAGTLGWTALNALPRMQELQSSKNDQAIQGRVAAFRFGMAMMNSRPNGIGCNRFVNAFFRMNHYRKAAHSSYVNVGAELGAHGLYLFLGILYCCLRTLLFARTTTDDEERVRRILFVLVFSYCVSSWMVGWSYRTTYFLMAAGTAALHRHLLKKQNIVAVSTDAPVVEVETTPSLAFGQLQPAGGMPAMTVGQFVLTPPAKAATDSATTTTAKPRVFWNRIGWVDVVCVYLIFRGAIWYWNHLIETM